MDFPRPSKSAGELFNSLKDKISFQGRNNERDEYYEDEFYDESVDGFDEVMVDGANDYGPYGYDAPYEDSYSYTTRSASSRSHHASSPHLVSSEVARASASSLGLGTSRFTKIDPSSCSTNTAKDYSPLHSFFSSALLLFSTHS